MGLPKNKKAYPFSLGMSDHEELFAAIDEIERHGRKRGRRDEYSFSVSDEEDFPPVDVLPDDHQEGEQEEILPQEHGPRRNIVRPFGEPGDLDDEEEPDPEEEGDEADRDADREERRRVPASRVESDRRVFDSEQEEIGLRRTRSLNRHFFPEAGEEGERDFDVDTYPDEHAAGMILPHVILDNENIYFRSLFTVINEMGKETTRLLRIRFNGKGVDREGKEATSLTEEDLSNCRAWLKYWTAYVVEHHYTVLGRVLRLPIGPDGADESITCTACLMWEIWRITVILRYDDLDKHRKWKIKDSEFLCDRLVNTPGVPLDPAPIAPIAPTEKELEKGNKERLLQKYNEAMGVYNEALGKWKKKKLVIDTPVLLLKQSQIRHLLQFISSRMRIVPYHEDMKLLLDILELKSAIFFCRHMPSGLLDEPKFRSDIRNDEARLAGFSFFSFGVVSHVRGRAERSGSRVASGRGAIWKRGRPIQNHQGLSHLLRQLLVPDCARPVLRRALCANESARGCRPSVAARVRGPTESMGGTHDQGARRAVP